MANRSGAQHGVRVSRRENEVYELGCQLVEAATGIARCAGDADAARAVPALLGCIETALERLGAASLALQRVSSERPSDTLESSYTNLLIALNEAACASRTARELAARSADP